MCGTILLVSLAAATVNLASSEVSYFPGSYFDQEGRTTLQRRALETWPGPTRLAELWFSDEFDGRGRVALLLGAAAFHDPQLLPVYRDALASDSQRFRQAAAYGYRDLIGDRLPDVRQPIDDRTAAALDGEMAAVAETLRRHPLSAIWLQAVLAPSGGTLPGYQGVVLNRAQGDVLRSLDRVLEPTDLDLVETAWWACDELEIRIALVRLAQGLALTRFVQIPGGAKPVWGPKVYDRALEDFAAWLDTAPRRGCRLDASACLRAQLRQMGLDWVEDPFGGAACLAWQQVLLKGSDSWWPLAARQLYRCGGPTAELTTVDVTSDASRASRERVLEFYRLRSNEAAARIAAAEAKAR